MQIESKRLILREMTMDDYDALFKIIGDPEVMKYYPHPFDEEGVKRWITRNIDRYGIFGFGLWAVILKETGELIGDCGLTMQLIKGQIKPEIGYHIGRDYQRQGYGSEAARATRDWSFLNTPFNIIYSYMKADNVGSYSTATAMGMQKVDEYEDENNIRTKVYAITREEWKVLKQNSNC